MGEREKGSQRGRHCISSPFSVSEKHFLNVAMRRSRNEFTMNQVLSFVIIIIYY